jgi:CheY-like chemotaxis protein
LEFLVHVGPTTAQPNRALSILLAEDSEDTRSLLELHLIKRGHTVVTAATGREGIRSADAQPFDVVVADVLMPDGDGVELMNHLRETRHPARIVAISGGGRYVDADYCRTLAEAAGAHCTLLKPFRAAELISAIEAEAEIKPQ